MSDLREVTQADVPQLTRLFAENIETSMFPLTNLKTHGLAGQPPARRDRLVPARPLGRVACHERGHGHAADARRGR